MNINTNNLKRAFSLIFVYRNPFRYLQAKLSKDRNEIGTIRLWNGSRFKLHMGNSDINSVSEVFGTGAYRYFFSKIKQGDVFIDVGANIGIVSVSAGLRGAKVTAFEPNPYVIGLLKENLLLNHISAAIHTEGIAGRSEKRDLNVTPGMWGGASLYGTDGESIKIDCAGINDVLGSFDVIDFLKIDIEGGEKEVLDAISDTNAQKIKNIFVEIHFPFASAEFVSEKLQAYGFRTAVSNEFCAVVGERLK